MVVAFSQSVQSRELTLIDEELWTIEAKTHVLDLQILDEASVALSLGAGGKIKQSIIEDANDPRIWDLANSRLVNIQLVNSAVFEEITTFLTPKTPISMQTYLESGLPFYDIYHETPSKIAGEFSRVKTLAEIDAARDVKPDFEYDPVNPPACSRCRKSLADCV
jgi:hypothetical protein